MVMKELPTFCTSTRVMFGTIATKSRGDSIPAASIACWVKTFSVTGTFWIVSSRLRAVTTTSSSVVAWLCPQAEWRTGLHPARPPGPEVFCATLRTCEPLWKLIIRIWRRRSAPSARPRAAAARSARRPPSPAASRRRPRAQVFHAAIGCHQKIRRIDEGQRSADPVRHNLRRLDGVGTQVDDAEDNLLAGQRLEHGAVEARLRGLDRDLRAAALAELRQERIADGRT